MWMNKNGYCEVGMRHQEMKKKGLEKK